MQVAKIIPHVEFGEIMNDFTNPLEIIREAIQNSVDENADKIVIDIMNVETSSGDSLNITIEDNGSGIKPENFENFFDLGNSTKKGKNLIGEKGHGTKIFYNSNRIILESYVNSKKYRSQLDNPFKKIFSGENITYTDPQEIVNDENKEHGVRVTIEGYLKNTSSSPMQKFSHPAVRDYILWFTAYGSVQNQLTEEQKNKTILFRTYDSKVESLQKEFVFKTDEDGFERIEDGHIFPSGEIITGTELKKRAKEKGIRNWEDLFCKRLYCKEIMLDGVEQPIQIVVWAEGDQYKKLHNKLIRERISSSTRDFQYKVSDRYGFWACKNYIPIQRVDHWLSGKGNYTKFHAFVNYDGFSLTANRSSIENTRPEVLKKIRVKVDEIYHEVINDKDYIGWVNLENLAKQERNAEQEKREFKTRLKKCKTRRKLKIGLITYFEPEREGEVAMLFDGLLQTYPELIKLQILDYSTHNGIDFLVRENEDIPIENDSTVGYIELKHNFETGRFNHSFEKLRQIICYDVKGLKIDDDVSDLNLLKLKVIKDQNKWILADAYGKVGHSIPIFVIKDFLKSQNKRFE